MWFNPINSLRSWLGRGSEPFYPHWVDWRPYGGRLMWSPDGDDTLLESEANTFLRVEDNQFGRVWEGSLVPPKEDPLSLKSVLLGTLKNHGKEIAESVYGSTRDAIEYQRTAPAPPSVAPATAPTSPTALGCQHLDFHFWGNTGYPHNGLPHSARVCPDCKMMNAGDGLGWVAPPASSPPRVPSRSARNSTSKAWGDVSVEIVDQPLDKVVSTFSSRKRKAATKRRRRTGSSTSKRGG